MAEILANTLIQDSQASCKQGAVCAAMHTRVHPTSNGTDQSRKPDKDQARYMHNSASKQYFVIILIVNNEKYFVSYLRNSFPLCPANIYNSLFS